MMAMGSTLYAEHGYDGLPLERGGPGMATGRRRGAGRARRRRGGSLRDLVGLRVCVRARSPCRPDRALLAAVDRAAVRGRKGSVAPRRAGRGDSPGMAGVT